ncbi:MAG: AAA family ATPase [Anaerolinea sp.]|nr:AAA family ATPase [Anaerolinea sp.]
MSDQSATIPQIRPAKTTNPLPGVFTPLPINKVEDTGLGLLWLQDLALKIIYFQGYLTGLKIAEALALPFAGIVDQILEGLKRDKMIEVRSSQMGLGESAYLYAITGAGIIRAREALDRCQYAGPAPVPLEVYNDAIRHQSRERVQVNNRNMHQVLGDLTFGESTFQKLGPAVNSGTSIFIYGAPGNGKTSVARAIGNLILAQTIYIPYSLFSDGQVITLFDSTNHKLAPEEDSTAQNNRGGMRKDVRWVKICRPFIMVGGELTLAGLDLVFNDTLKFYEAPIQVKANGGILLIDDFGRQQVRPRDLLNRWIVPLENRIDYMSLHTGRKIEVPFDVLVIFSTNLPPRDLVDEAFLRRLRHKIEIVDPSYEEYRDIFKKVATAKNIHYSDEVLAYLLQEWYIKPARKLRASHPRDLCDQILDIAHYLAVEPVMSKEMIDKAAESYFVEL